MSTTPHLPPDEAPLDDETIDLFVSNMGTDMVLVGGQALAYWMDRFDIENKPRMAISNDADALGKVGRAIAVARTIRARVDLPEKSSRTAIVAQLRLPTADGRERNIDVLHKLFTVAGLRTSTVFTNRVIADSVEVEWSPGHNIRVMDPFDVLESRVQKAVGLIDEKGEHVLTQARWAIEVAKAALFAQASDAASGERFGFKLPRIYTLARSQVGRRLLKEHGIELLLAVDVAGLRPLAPKHAMQLDAIEAAIRERQPKASLPASTKPLMMPPRPGDV